MEISPRQTVKSILVCMFILKDSRKIHNKAVTSVKMRVGQKGPWPFARLFFILWILQIYLYIVYVSFNRRNEIDMAIMTWKYGKDKLIF